MELRASSNPTVGIRRADAPGDRLAMLERLYERHAAAIYTIALRVTQAPALAEDVVEEVLLAAWRAPSLVGGAPNEVRRWMDREARQRAMVALCRRAPDPPEMGGGTTE